MRNQEEVLKVLNQKAQKEYNENYFELNPRKRGLILEMFYKEANNLK